MVFLILSVYLYCKFEFCTLEYITNVKMLDSSFPNLQDAYQDTSTFQFILLGMFLNFMLCTTN